MNKKNPLKPTRGKYKNSIVQYVAWRLVKHLYRFFLEKQPMPESFLVLPVARTEFEIPFVHRPIKSDNSSLLVLQNPYSKRSSKVNQHKKGQQGF
ncbi:hypothetical protein CF595_01200 [Gallibacterium anatis]|nr:hypothetical protein CF595_01200 [Gallibacterium anatis]